MKPNLQTCTGIALAVLLLGLVVRGGAQQPAPEPSPATVAEIEAASAARAERDLARSLDRIAARADSVYQSLRPVPLLRPAEESALRRYLNRAHLGRARSLGVDRPAGEAELEALRREGRLVPLEARSPHWVLRDLDASEALVTPDVVALLTEIGERFHARLAERGLPPFRLEISSALRTGEQQARLRRSNPNAARGVSTHEFGTTVDVAYDGYTAPESTGIELETGGAPWLEPHLNRVASAMLERAAVRKSRELQAILGRVLREMQAEGKVMVTLERLQPVYHMTVASRLADDAS